MNHIVHHLGVHYDNRSDIWFWMDYVWYLILQSGRAMDHVHHEQARHSSRGSLVRAKAGKVTFDKHDASDGDDLVSSPLDELCIYILIYLSGWLGWWKWKCTLFALYTYSDEKIGEKNNDVQFSEACSPMPSHGALPLPHLCRKDNASSSGVALLKFALYIYIYH